MFLMTMVVAATMSVAVAAGASTTRRDGSFLWALAIALYVLAYALFSFRNHIDAVSSIIVANAVFSSIFATFTEALYQFQRRPAPHFWIWTPVAITLLSFTIFLDSFSARTILNGAISIAQIVPLLLLLNQGRKVTPGRGQYFVATGFILLVPLYILRVALTAMGKVGATSMLESDSLQTISYLSAAISLPLLGVGFLVMTKERAEEQNHVLATLDQLTGLANRRSMDEALDKEWRRAKRSGRPLTLTMIDVDLFKHYNDRYGHQAGDNCLKTFAQIIQQGLRRASDFPARYGGEEFMLILPDTDTSSANKLVEKLRKSLASQNIPHELSPTGRVTFSAGLAALENDTYPDLASLIRAADDAMYQAKQNGRDQVRTASGSPSPPESNPAISTQPPQPSAALT